MSASNINLKLLQTFQLAAEHGSFRRAAEESNRSPSAVSMQIRDLEEQIGVSLFVRTPQSANLTPSGAILYEQVRMAMAGVQAGLDRLSDVAAQRRSHVSIGCAPTLAATRLGNILATFKLRYPRSVINLKETPPMDALTFLREQQVELYVGPEVPNMSDFHFEPILKDRFAVCIPAEFDEGAASFSLADIASFPLIVLDRQTAARGLLDRISGDLDLNIQYEVQYAYTAITLAAAGLGVAVVPFIAVPMLPTSAFRVLPLTDEGAERAVGIITARGHVPHNYSQQLMDLIRTELGRNGAVAP
ncbi:LysR family transcriptional regulator [Paracoccus seriniphilus]|uniref:DNA-binding transcriptional regulator, LysR family n=1 Tax=Paracoccus seriniphilus TaxID=184748 RepID=A0A239Q3X1_9RHOB|nr:LysR family transcriptional regulator [Paracoccus seriniphilus]WCR15928.1 LysR family transcriptional regulator [Paracoccus seriniphilus]SNT76966.1 DNA-binding transcriptional regulator, LysR family [Paracoccus seriniphilus]